MLGEPRAAVFDNRRFIKTIRQAVAPSFVKLPHTEGLVEQGRKAERELFWLSVWLRAVDCRKRARARRPKDSLLLAGADRGGNTRCLTAAKTRLPPSVGSGRNGSWIRPKIVQSRRRQTRRKTARLDLPDTASALPPQTLPPQAGEQAAAALIWMAPP